MDGTLATTDRKASVGSRASRLVQRLLVTGLMFGLIAVAAPGGPVSPEPAAASHSNLMTLRGTVTIAGFGAAGAGVALYYWTGSRWAVSRTTTTNADGNYAIVAGRNHRFRLGAVKIIGTLCMPYGGLWQWSGATEPFYTSMSWHNPTYIDIAMSGGQIC